MFEHETELCQLHHPAFALFAAAVFRKAEGDGTPVMVVRLGAHHAAVPLRALQRQLAIADDSADGRMFALIAEALDYVVGLSLGDRLPREVLDGEASWQPAPRHLRRALAGLREQLLKLDGMNEMQSAFAQATRALGLAGPEQVVASLEALGQELAYIEALRERLLHPVRALVARLGRLRGRRMADGQMQEALTQVERLATIGLRGIGAGFQDVDACTGDVISALRHASQQRGFIRSNRDWLYRSARAWSPILAEWDGAVAADALPGLLGRTYQFLAPRYMPVTEWFTLRAVVGAGRRHAMTWQGTGRMV
jgi:hypothetical protein